MAPTFELICHHTYSGFGGLPVDLSDHDSHGQAFDTEFLKDGVASGSGALRFAQPQSRVLIPASSPWQTLGGIKVEITARLNGYRSLPRNLIRGPGSFMFFVWNRELIAAYETTKSTWPGSNLERISTFSNPIQYPAYQFEEWFDQWPAFFQYVHSPAYQVPFDKWITFGFVHNGLDTMELYAYGQLVAQRTGLLAGVPGVGPEGVFIGAGTGFVLNGDIDEVKVWRVNPHIVDGEFFSRPADEGVARCWERFFRSLAKALERHPDCARFIQGALDDLLDRMQRTIVAKGPETRERFDRTSREYLLLWRDGKLDSPEMARLFTDWCEWLRLVDISIEQDPALQRLLQSDCLRRVLAECEPPDCDPQMAEFLRLIVQNCRQGAATSA
ncbi:MAG TPA: hypothetical protein VF068_00280 [Rubrobacter sp.]